MPTYKNETTNPIVVHYVDHNGMQIKKRIEVDETVATDFIYDDASLTTVSADPYFNPLIASDVLTAAGAEDEQIAINLYTKTIAIINYSDQNVVAYLTAKVNTPSFDCPANSIRTIAVGHNVNLLIVTFPAAASVTIEQRR